MKTKLLTIAIVACLAASYSYAQKGKKHPLLNGVLSPAGPVAPGQQKNTTMLDDGYSFTEGPAVDQDGNVFFTDQPNDRIYRWDGETGEITLFLEGTGRSNGMAFDADGNLIACADMYGEIWKIFPDGTHEVLIDNYNGRRLNGPNDVWINPVNGGMYITDPMFPRGYWDEDDPRRQPDPNLPVWPPTHSDQTPGPNEGKAGHVYYLAPGATELVRVTTMDGWDDDGWPNGVVGTPDGLTLYVNKWAPGDVGGTEAFNIEPDGSLSNIRPLTVWGGDGMSMDELGNIYISNGRGVMAFDSFGNNIATFPINAGGATNNTFMGKHNKQLFVTAGGTIDLVKLKVRGARLW